MAEHNHSHEEAPERPLPPETPVDAGSQALSEALRSSFGIVKFVMGILVLVFILSGVFVVKEQERAIKLRFGRPVGLGEKALLGPGLHWSLPYPIESYEKVSVSGIKKVTSTVGWFATTPEMELSGADLSVPMGTPLNPVADGYALTADNNIVHTRATLNYRIADPVRYVFYFVNASNMIQATLDNALIYAASRFNVDAILTHNVAGFRDAIRQRVIDLADQQQLGIVVEECQVQSRPPRQLKDAFENVLRAEVTRNKVLDEARSYENQVLSKASADSQSRINAAESERARLVNDVRSQAERFNEVLPKYQANPKLFIEQRLAETLGRSLTNVETKLFLTEAGDGQPKEFRMLLNRPPKKNEEVK
jgi:modulator of FtsH protease HflK